jgi:TolB-like protein
MSLFAELKRRNVFKVAAVYVVTAWLLLQVADVVLNNIAAPGWIFQVLLLLLSLGLPLAVIFAWAFELTPDGIQRESTVDRSESITPATGNKLTIVLVSLLVVTIGFIAWDSLVNAPVQEAPVSDLPADAADEEMNAPVDDSIAVLPLVNMSAIPDNEYFAGGVHEEILTNLSRIEGLRVVSRTTALRYLNADLSLRDIGHELGVRYIVEGSVRRINDHVRITVQLIDATEDEHLWASNYDRELVDVFAMQSEVATEITNSLHLEIQPETVGTLDGMPTRSVKAYDLFIKAESIERSEVGSEDAFRRQRELLESAVLEDPDFAEAWAYLKRILDEIVIGNIVRDWFGETDAERDAYLAEAVEARKRALERAKALDPDNIETVLAQASEDYIAKHEDINYSAEQKVFIDRALELQPDNAEAWRHLAWYQWNEGNIDLARTSILKALELDPLHARNVEGAHTILRNVGDEEMTAQLAERLVQIAPEAGEDKFLAEIPSATKLETVLGLFRETADESIIDTYAETYAAESENFIPMTDDQGGNLEWYKAFLMVLRNDLDGLADLKPEALSDADIALELSNYMFVNNLVLAAQKIEGRDEDATVTARRMLAAADASVPGFKLPVAAAYAALGDEEKLLEIRDALAKEDGNRASSLNPWIHVDLGYIDPDGAVELLLAKKEAHPTWQGMDWLAINHVGSRHVIIHPDMQAFYIEEGKWVNYLAARVPEYAKYRQ